MTRPPFPASHLRLKRAYEPAEPEDGVRIRIDQLWPRGVSKAEAEFQRRYRAELRQHGQDLDRIRALAKTQIVTLVYSAHDGEHNDAIVLKEVLLEGMRSPRDG
jgi:uncharacterized protein YeaO (DUF488 family)